MDIFKEVHKGTLHVRLAGNFTFSDHPGFRDVLDKVGESGVINVVFDMGGLVFVDSAALGMMLLALDTAEKRQKTLSIIGATGQVKKMFSLARFHTLFAMS